MLSEVPHFILDKQRRHPHSGNTTHHMNDESRQLYRLGLSNGLDGGEGPNSEYTGVRALMLAILDGALQNYCGPPGRLRLEAEAWIRWEGRRWVFSFATVCEVLGLDPGATRRAVERLRSADLKPHERRLRGYVARGSAIGKPPPLARRSKAG